MKINMKFNTYFILFALIFFTACKKERTWDDVPATNVDLVIHDISKNFFNQAVSIKELRTDYPFFFDERSDSIWEKQRRDKIEISIYEQSRKVFGDFQELDAQLAPMLARYHYYFPEYKVPLVYTYSSGLQNLDYPVMFSAPDALMFIAMDGFLGADSKFYDSMGVDRYLRANLFKERVASQAVDAIANNIVTFSPTHQQFLDKILFEGKKLILQDALLTDTPEEYKIGYTPKQLAWCVANEGQIWNFFVEQNYVFSTDNTLQRRFLDIAPFSKFNNEIEQDSPGRIGAWLGWQIARSYLKQNPDVSLQAFLLDMDSQKIFQNSKYKPAINGDSSVEYTTKKKEGVDELYHYAE